MLSINPERAVYFDKKFSLAKTLTNIRNSSNATTASSNAQLLSSLLNTFNVDSKIYYSYDK
jgi:hypothetical protein